MIPVFKIVERFKFPYALAEYKTTSNVINKDAQVVEAEEVILFG